MDGMSEFETPGLDSILAWGYGNHPNPVAVYEFDYAAPAGDEDATINTLTEGDLVYVTGNKVKKLKTTTLNAAALATVVGVCIGIKDDNGNVKDTLAFTADGGEVLVAIGKATMGWFGDKVYIHNDDVTSPAPNTRDAFAYATHVTGSVLEGIVRPDALSGGRAVYTFA